MNYRHIYHAGNFADVMKHVLLARVLAYLAQKDTPFHIIDTHAGIGRYDLDTPQAQKTGEWRDGIGKVLAARLSPAAAALAEPYLAMVRDLNPDFATSGDLKVYPGSPLIEAGFTRRGDQLSLCELHPEDHTELAELMAHERGAKVYDLDGWIALKSFLPPKERRGLVLIDPPFEANNEFDRLGRGLLHALKRFANGVYMLWYPVKDIRLVRSWQEALVDAGVRRMLAIELRVAELQADGPLGASGVLVINPPWTLAAEARVLMPELAKIMARGPGAGAWIEDLAGE